MWAMNKKLRDCPVCGVTVIHHRGDDLSPVEGYHLTGNLLSHDMADVAKRKVYVNHTCDPSDIQEQTTRQDQVLEGLRALYGTEEDRYDQADLTDALEWADRTSAELQALIYEHGLTRPCPKCDASEGDRCENLSARKRSVFAYTKYPHQERLPVAEMQSIEKLVSLREENANAHVLLDKIHLALQGQQAIEQLIAIAGRETPRR